MEFIPWQSLLLILLKVKRPVNEDTSSTGVTAAIQVSVFRMAHSISDFMTNE